MKYYLFVSLLLVGFTLNAQDIIYLKTGEEVKTKVIKITQNQVEYKKYTNLDGPLYTLEKNQIFFITYENGEKEIFKESEAATKVYSQKEEFVLNPNIGELGCADNNYRKGGNMYGIGVRIYGSQIDRVYKSDDLVYYGADVSYSKVIDSKKMDEGAEFLDEKVTSFQEVVKVLFNAQDLRRWMKKESVMMGTNLDSNAKLIDPNNFVVSQNYCLSFEDIQEIVKGYVLDEKEGIGMVVNVAAFNENREERKKLQEFISLYVTFFDIETREVLFSVESTGFSSAPRAWWQSRYAVGFNYAVRFMFIDRVYIKGISNVDQLHKKYRLDSE